MKTYFLLICSLFALSPLHALDLKITTYGNMGNSQIDILGTTPLEGYEWNIDQIKNHKFLKQIFQNFNISSNKTLKKRISECTKDRIKEGRFKSLESSALLCTCNPFYTARNFVFWDMKNIENLILLSCEQSNFSKYLLVTNEQIQEKKKLEEEEKLISPEIFDEKAIEKSISNKFIENCDFHKNCDLKCKDFEQVTYSLQENKKTRKIEEISQCQNICSEPELNPENIQELVALPYFNFSKNLHSKSSVDFQLSYNFKNLVLPSINKIDQVDLTDGQILFNENIKKEKIKIFEDIKKYSQVGFNTSQDIPYCFECPENTFYDKSKAKCVNKNNGCLHFFEEYDEELGCIEKCNENNLFSKKLKSCLPKNICSQFTAMLVSIKMSRLQVHNQINSKDYKCKLDDNFYKGLDSADLFINSLLEEINSDSYNKELQNYINTLSKLEESINGSDIYKKTESICSNTNIDPFIFSNLTETLNKGFETLTTKIRTPECPTCKENEFLTYDFSEGTEICAPKRCQSCYEKIEVFKNQTALKEILKIDFENKCQQKNAFDSYDLISSVVYSKNEEYLNSCLKNETDGASSCAKIKTSIEESELKETLETDRFTCDEFLQ